MGLVYHGGGIKFDIYWCDGMHQIHTYLGASIAIEDCTRIYELFKITYHNSKDAFDQKELI